MSTLPLLCSRCQSAPRLPRQRWCRQCLTSAQRQRRSVARRTAQADDATAPVTHASTQAMARVTQGDVTPDQQQALLAYRIALQEYEARRTPQPGRLPIDRSSILVALQLKVEAAKQRCRAFGIDPAIITERAQEIRP